MRTPKKYTRAAGGLGVDLWRIPLRTCVLILLLFIVTIAIDSAAASGRITLPHWFSVGGYEDADTLLAAMMGTVSTVVALIFSVTLLVLSMAESQLGPRLVYRFLRDRTMQYTIGLFLATFLFVLLTFVVLRREQDNQFIPQVTTLTSVLLMMASFGMLVAYNHRVASSIQTNDAVAHIVDDLVSAVEELKANRSGGSGQTDSISLIGDKEKEMILARLAAEGATIAAARSGYVQTIAHEELITAALRSDATVEILFRPGQFVREGDQIARVLPAERIKVIEKIVLESIEVGANRTLEQDIEFALAQLVEVALRAMSPAINDTFTGVMCIDWLGDAVRMFAALPPSNGISCRSDGRITLVERPLKFSHVVKSAFDQVRQAGTDNPAVIIRLLQTWGRIAPKLNASQSADVLQQAESVYELAAGQAFSKLDRADIDGAYQTTVNLLSGVSKKREAL